MKSTGVIVTVALLVLVSTTVFGASAFTTATVDRDANLNVAADNNAVIGLNAGPSAMVTQTSGGELIIDSTVSGATGVNGDATFVLGDNSSATTMSAFNVTNNAGATKDITLSYSGFVTGDNANSLQFEVYDSGGNRVGRISESSSSLTLSGVSDGATHYVVVEIKTTNGDLGSSDDLSGTLTVSA